MRNSLKVAKWEIKRNMSSRSFIISLFLTPLIFILFSMVPLLISDGPTEEAAPVEEAAPIEETAPVDEVTQDEQGNAVVPGGMEDVEAGPPLERIVPGLFAGLVLFSVVITGMMIFQSASQEKKEKIAEIILSSLTPGELMQGKIIGYFVLGMIQVGAWLIVAVPYAQWRFDLPLLNHLFAPELAILLLFAVGGYLLFAALFVGLGATVEDINTSGNFQGIIFILPWLPLILMGPILSDLTGVVARVASYIPFTAPGVMLIRLSLMETWPWFDIILSLAILLVSIWLLMKLAGKIFKIGMLLYGKNASLREILKWITY